MYGRLQEAELRIGYVPLLGTSASTLPRLVSRLGEADQIRLETFLSFEDKVAFAVGRLLLQRMLSDCSPEPPDGWRIRIRKLGKPELLQYDNAPDIRFNITHCAGLVAAVVALNRDVGIDAESLDNTADYFEIAQMHLPAAEVSLLDGLTGDSRRQAFFDLWTLREAYVKAVGEGLLKPFADVHFSLNPPIAFSGFSNEALADYSFWSEKPTPAHTVAVAARRDPAEQLFCRREFFEVAALSA